MIGITLIGVMDGILRRRRSRCVGKFGEDGGVGEGEGKRESAGIARVWSTVRNDMVWKSGNLEMALQKIGLQRRHWGCDVIPRLESTHLVILPSAYLVFRLRAISLHST